jgi:alpha-beta hydrolase superfamily lysophospholipase
MYNSEEDIFAEDSTRLHVYRWVPDNAHSAVVLSHGWSEHAGRYQNVAKWLTEQGYEVHALDHRGHGKSDGKRGHVDQWEDYARDLETLRKTLKHHNQYLLGHSMGATVSILHMLQYPNTFRAAVLSGPATDLSYEVPKLKRWIATALAGLFPRLSLSGEADPSIVCGDPDIVAAYERDPLVHGKISLRWFTDYLRVIQHIKDHVGSVQTPVGIWHGAGDSLVAPWVGEQLFKGLSIEDKHLCLVDNALHEILFEKNWLSTAQEMKTWFEKH